MPHPDTQAYDEKAAELEAAGVVPYKIDSNGFFESARKYPIIASLIPQDETKIAFGGDTLLYLYSPNGEFNVVFYGGRTFHSTDQRLNLFTGGLPLIGQCWPPKIERLSPETKVYAVLEVYGTQKRRELASWCDARDGNYGVRLKGDNGAEYRVYGKQDPGHSHNTVVLA